MSGSKAHSFLIRLLTSLVIVCILIPAYILFDGIPLKAILFIAVCIAAVEARSLMDYAEELRKKAPKRPNFLRSRNYTPDGQLAVFVLLLIIGASLATMRDRVYIGLAMVGTVTTDASAYLVGTCIGGKIFKVRPFPQASPKKSWEGLIGGMVFGLIAINLWLKYFVPSPLTFVQVLAFMSIPILAICGDVVESSLKRGYGVKDVNDHTPSFLAPFEKLLGGREGHGGYLDRLDSLAFVLITVMLASPKL
ncbi:phosphatidate cytidylyltransferase [Candidatus Saccharibacteria bacterium]|nr:phosphatidate cytidylyltransferase [Candidatus Saccharibacteria bacterium]